MKKFWKWKNQAATAPAERTLFRNGTIAEESWFDDDVTPQLFKEELMAGDGDITVWINSPGGDCVAAAQIYNMLMDYPHNVTVKIDGIAASAASVIAMAGTKVLGIAGVHDDDPQPHDRGHGRYRRDAESHRDAWERERLHHQRL